MGAAAVVLALAGEAAAANLLVNPGGEINAGASPINVNGPTVPGWEGDPGGQVIQDRTIAGNGRWRISFEDGQTLYQLTGHTIAPGEAFSLRFDSSAFSGLPPSVTPQLYVMNGTNRQTVAGRTYSFEPLAVNDWQHFQLLTDFGALDAYTGRLIGVQFKGPSNAASRYLSVDGVSLEAFAAPSPSNAFSLSWADARNGTWLGPDLWANRLQDWQVANDRIECLRWNTDLRLRTVHLLTERANEEPQAFWLRVRLGLVVDATHSNFPANAVGGFLFGAGPTLDYRGAALVHQSGGKGGGLVCGVTAEGRATIRANDNPAAFTTLANGNAPASVPAQMDLLLTAAFDGANYLVTVKVFNAATSNLLSQASTNLAPHLVLGNLGLVSHPGTTTTGEDMARYWFADWRGGGGKLDRFPERALGPLVGVQHTLSRRILKMTAQLLPVNTAGLSSVSLQLGANGTWATAASAAIDPDAFTATFRLTNWNAAAATPYRVEARYADAAGAVTTQRLEGTVRADPVGKDEIVVGNLSCVAQVANEFSGVDTSSSPIHWTPDWIIFPQTDLVDNVSRHQPDLLFFAGDQVYEGGSPTKKDLDNLELDYLYKWLLYSWAFRDLTRDIPTVTIPDDHDVFQGNLWGQGGRAATDQMDGGYIRPASFVKLVERTQTSHLPDPYDPTPVAQGIGVHYTGLKYGRIGFAILEDRKFKYGPNDPTPLADKDLLGDRQIAFLDAWTRDWAGEDLKATLSETLLCSLKSHGSTAFTYGTQDQDSNGWPPAARREALAAIRRGFAVMLAGDTHLGSVVHHGIDAYGDAGFSACSPAGCNLYLRAWDPTRTASGAAGALGPYKGNWLDGHGNFMTVHAVANPAKYTNGVVGMPPDDQLHARGTGYSIVKFRKSDRTIRMECWPRYVNPDDPATGGQYADWPVTVRQTDNYGRTPSGFLPVVENVGRTNFVVEVIDATSTGVLYSLRVSGARFRPPVFTGGTYTVRILDPDTGLLLTRTNQSPLSPTSVSIRVFEAGSFYAVSNTPVSLAWDAPGATNLMVSPGVTDAAYRTYNGIGRADVTPISNATYTLTAYGPGGPVQTQIMIKVFDTLETWRVRHFTAAERLDPLVSGDGADPDGDGIQNLIEYFLATDPRADSRAALPSVGIAPYPSGAGAEAFFTFRQRGLLNVATVRYAVEGSADLVQWTAWSDLLRVEVAREPGGPGETDTHVLREAAPIRSHPERVLFVRMRLVEDGP